MGDYNIYFLNEKRRQHLDTITKPYGMRVTNIEYRTRVQGNGVTFIYYITTNLPQMAKF